MHGKVAVARDQMKCAEEQEMRGEREGKRRENKRGIEEQRNRDKTRQEEEAIRKRQRDEWIGNAGDRTMEVTEKAGKVKGGKRRREEKRHMKGTHTLRKKKERQRSPDNEGRLNFCEGKK